MDINEVLACADRQPANSVWHLLAAEVRRQRGENEMKIDIDEVVQFVMQADEEYGLALAEGLNKLRTELERERKRLDWALEHGASWAAEDGDLWWSHPDAGDDFEDIELEQNCTNPRATIDELMGE